MDDWQRAGGHDARRDHIAEAFEHFYLLIQAAKCGLGLANVPRMLVRDDLAAGHWSRRSASSPGPNRLALWVAPQLSRRPDAVRLVDWLEAELRATER